MQVESVQLIADGKAPRIPQTEEGATYEGIQKKSNAKVRALTPNMLDHQLGKVALLSQSILQQQNYIFFLTNSR